VGVPIQKENEAPLGPEVKGEENREEVSLLIKLMTSTLGSGRALSSPNGVQGRAPAENGFIVI